MVMNLEIQRILNKIDLKKRNNANVDEERIQLLNTFLYDYCVNKDDKHADVLYAGMLKNKELAKKIILSQALIYLKSKDFEAYNMRLYNEMLFNYVEEVSKLNKIKKIQMKKVYTKGQLKKAYIALYKEFFKKPIIKNELEDAIKYLEMKGEK